MPHDIQSVSQGPASRKRAIFRPEALRHYMEGREKTVLPRYAAPPALALMWILLGVALVAGLMLTLSYLGQRGGV